MTAADRGAHGRQGSPDVATWTGVFAQVQAAPGRPSPWGPM